jgi:hypothetical protein
MKRLKRLFTALLTSLIMIRAVLLTAVAASGIHMAAIAGAEPPDAAVPGMHSGAVETQPCNNRERYAYGWSPDGQVMACVSFDGGRTGMWASSATLVGVQQIGSACEAISDRYGGALAQAPDGSPLRCSDASRL